MGWSWLCLLNVLGGSENPRNKTKVVFVIEAPAAYLLFQIKEI